MSIREGRILIIAVIATLMIPGSASAAWFEWLKVTGILVHNDSLEVTLEGNSGCNRIFRLSQTEPNYNVKASALLSAYYAGHEVSLDYTGDLGSCTTPLHRFKVRR
jgi:hypothetical protein